MQLPSIIISFEKCYAEDIGKIICKRIHHLHIHKSKIDTITAQESSTKKSPQMVTTYNGKVTWQEYVASANDKKAP